MPLHIFKFGDQYGIVNIHTGALHSTHTCLAKAKKQLKLIQMIDANKKNK